MEYFECERLMDIERALSDCIRSEYILKYVCGYLGVSLIQPKEILSDSILAPLPAIRKSNFFLGYERQNFIFEG